MPVDRPAPWRTLWTLVPCLLSPGVALAQAPAGDAPAPVPTPPALNSGDTAWMLTSTALVLLMTIPGLALFYGGLVRSKNILSTLMHSLFCAALISVVWVVVGYTLAFGPSQGGWIGGLDFLGLRGVANSTNALAPSIPHYLFVAFQMTFAVITPALISGAFAERMRFPGFVLFTLFWSLIIYAPLAHWVWGGGFIGTKIGALDFAGGTVVHIASGISALVTALFLGKRVGYGQDPMPPHNLPFTVIGAGLLWVGWFGFNAGSAVASNELASVALINTNTAAAAAALGWLAMEMFRNRHATILGAASGAVAGLVAITPGAGFVSPLAALGIGLLGGGVCYLAVTFKPRFGYDDALDVVGVHMVGGILGALLTGVFATKAVNPAVEALSLGLPGGLVEGAPKLIGQQGLAIAITLLYCGAGTLLILIVVNALTPLRAADDEETVGMDLSQHRERAYALGGEAVSISASEPRAASTPPLSGERFTALLAGVDPDRVLTRWRSLCQEGATPPSPEFRDVYSRVTTVRAQGGAVAFRFRGGDPEKARRSLETLFRDFNAAVTVAQPAALSAGK